MIKYLKAYSHKSGSIGVGPTQETNSWISPALKSEGDYLLLFKNFIKF